MSYAGSNYNYKTMTEVFGYQIRRQVARGGTAAIYEAEHIPSGEIVALKVPRSDLADPIAVRAKLLREARLQQAVSHPAVITVKDALTSPQSVVIVQEYFPGTTLWHRMESGQLAQAEKWAAAIRLCEGVAAIHKAGIIHMDLKPLNVLLPLNRALPLKITDFGEARRASDNSRLSSAEWGSPHFMSPEQCLGKTPFFSSDVYSLGVLLYRLFAGKMPYAAAAYEELISAHLHHTPEPAPDLPPVLAAVIFKALDKTPSARQKDAGELLSELQSCYNYIKKTD